MELLDIFLFALSGIVGWTVIPISHIADAS
jgi:hypothetical protein